MTQKITRKCAHCKSAIDIDRTNIHGTLLFKNKYYHTNCFIEMVKQKESGKRCAPCWKGVLNNIKEFENDANAALTYWFNRDDLYNHLLDNYDVASVSNAVFTRMCSMIDGTYGRKSKPIKLDEFVACWRDSQKELDKIALNNRKKGNEIFGEPRIHYDFAIIMRTFPKWKKEQEKRKAEIMEQKRNQTEKININYDSMQRTETKQQEGLGDISALLDDW